MPNNTSKTITTLMISLFLICCSLSSQAAEEPCAKAKELKQELEDYFHEYAEIAGVRIPQDILFESVKNYGTDVPIDDITPENEDFLFLVTDYNYYSAWCMRIKAKFKQTQWESNAGNSAKQRKTKGNMDQRADSDLSMVTQGSFELTSNSDGYVFLSFPQIQISNNSTCSHTFDFPSKVQMGIDADANISYQDADWSVNGFTSAAVSSFIWTFTADNGDACDGSWTNEALLIDDRGSSYNALTNTVYALVDILGTTYLLPIEIVTIDNQPQLLLADLLVVPWLTADAADSLNITLGILDVTQSTITLNSLAVIDPIKDITSSYNAVLRYDLTTKPISFEVVSVVPVI